MTAVKVVNRQTEPGRVGDSNFLDPLIGRIVASDECSYCPLTDDKPDGSLLPSDSGYMLDPRSECKFGVV